MAKQVGDYKIKVDIRIVESVESKVSGQIKRKDGYFEMDISEEKAISIDECERALLPIIYEAARDAMSGHLTDVWRWSSFRPLAQAVACKYSFRFGCDRF